MNGVTGRMGTNQHLVRSIVAIRAQGGVALSDGDRVMPDPILVGRNADKLGARQAIGVERWTTDLDTALATETTRSSSTRRRRRCGRSCRAGHRGRQAHLLREADRRRRSPRRSSLPPAEEAGVKNGVVQDKLFLPGLLKLKLAASTAAFLAACSRVRGEFGYWVFEGDCSRRSALLELPQATTAAASSST